MAWRVVVMAIVLAISLLLWWSAMALGAEPAPTLIPIATTGPVILGGDIRSDGAGPGLVGSPLAILLGVILLGAVTVAATMVIARFAKRP